MPDIVPNKIMAQDHCTCLRALNGPAGDHRIAGEGKVSFPLRSVGKRINFPLLEAAGKGNL